MGSRCPACARAAWEPYLREDEIAREIQLRKNFIFDRLDHKPEPPELMDLTDFMHGGPGRLLTCSHCGIAVRDEAQAAHYEDDFYDPALMSHLYPRYLAAFREKERTYRKLLPARANVMELGSHFGAFLQAAEEWNWRPVGVDIGACTSSFARSRGLTVRRQSLQEFSLRDGPSDALFIWNCFEQLENPREILIDAHRLLKPHALLVVRVPNLEFYRRWRFPMYGGNRQAMRSLGYNNLLGFPYRFGYTPAVLARLLRGLGFMPIAGHDTNLITMPFTSLPRWVRREYSAVRREGSGMRDRHDQNPQTVAGPWIEMVGRRVA